MSTRKPVASTSAGRRGARRTARPTSSANRRGGDALGRDEGLCAAVRLHGPESSRGRPGSSPHSDDAAPREQPSRLRPPALASVRRTLRRGTTCLPTVTPARCCRSRTGRRRHSRRTTRRTRTRPFRRSSRSCRRKMHRTSSWSFSTTSGSGASSAFGGPCNTPTADRLAAGGLRFNRFHTTALCAPTRQALLTGRNHHSVGMGSITETATSAPGNSSLRPEHQGAARDDAQAQRLLDRAVRQVPRGPGVADLAARARSTRGRRAAAGSRRSTASSAARTTSTSRRCTRARPPSSRRPRPRRATTSPRTSPTGRRTGSGSRRR